MPFLKSLIRDVPDFPKPGILFRDITPLLRGHLAETIEQLGALVEDDEWTRIDAIAGIEARGFILAAALAAHYRKGFVPIRKQGKLPPPVTELPYELEYGSSVLEIQPGRGRLLIVDDVLATGGTMRAAANLAQKAGYEICALTALIDLKLVDQVCWKNHTVRAAITY
jgi:adenine phosphoribosyltransferase